MLSAAQRREQSDISFRIAFPQRYQILFSATINPIACPNVTKLTLVIRTNMNMFSYRCIYLANRTTTSSVLSWFSLSKSRRFQHWSVMVVSLGKALLIECPLPPRHVFVHGKWLELSICQNKNRPKSLRHLNFLNLSKFARSVTMNLASQT